MPRSHSYLTTIRWTGNKGPGTADYRAYSRDYTISIEDKPDIKASADPSFRGNAMLHNPEELLLAALSACHMLSFLHLCAVNGIVVVEYSDSATGVMEQNNENGGKFTRVTLHPSVRVSHAEMIDKAQSLHAEANKVCFIASSCNFPVSHIPACDVAESNP